MLYFFQIKGLNRIAVSYDMVSKINNKISSALDGALPQSATKPPVSGSTIQADFANMLTSAQKTVAVNSTKPLPSRWHSLSFLTTQALPRKTWPWVRADFDRTVIPGLAASFNIIEPTMPATEPVPIQPMALDKFPRPPGDNGRGIHWIPTVKQSPEVIDRYVNEAVSMGMKWVVFLNEGTNIGDNDYLVKKLVAAGIEPVMRVYTPGLTPIGDGLKKMTSHFRKLGVHYFQLYNEPNLMVETGGQYPDVNRYLDLWIPAAKQIIEGGGLPGFGALSPQGEMDDREFLTQTLSGLKKRGVAHLLDNSWLSMHNYTGPRALADPDGFMRFKQYHNIIQQVLGRPLPIIGTEGGTHISEHVSETQQVDMVTSAYNYMRQREPYNFAYTYWIIANGHDPAWNEHALFRPDGPTKLANALKEMVAGVIK